jgi:acyl-CoA thioesterase FadM
MATPWTPPQWTAVEGGVVRPEFVWAALDCPATFAPLLAGPATTGFLVRLSASIDGPVVAGDEHVIVAWPIAIDGRKFHSGAALFSAGGELLAAARAMLVAPRD